MTYRIAEAERYLNWIRDNGFTIGISSSGEGYWVVSCLDVSTGAMVSCSDVILSVAITDAFLKVRSFYEGKKS